LQLFNKADLVISKGRGNFEGLHQTERDIYFLFIAKYPVIAQMINGAIGNMVLFYKKSGKFS
jgi:damage-control phosphatase, subfamily I